MALSDLEALERLQERLSKFSVDLPEYGADQRHLVFVYGTMKAGFRNHSRLKGSKFIDKGLTMGDCFLMWTKLASGGYRAPVLSLAGTFRVMGELYEVSGPTLARLDLCEGHPWVYERTSFLIQPGDLRKDPIQALMYIKGFAADTHLSRDGVEVYESARVMKYVS